MGNNDPSEKVRSGPSSEILISGGETLAIFLVDTLACEATVTGSAKGFCTGLPALGVTASEGSYHDAVLPALRTTVAPAPNGSLEAACLGVVVFALNGSSPIVGGRLTRRTKLNPRSSIEVGADGAITEILKFSSVCRRARRRSRKITRRISRIPPTTPPAIPPIMAVLEELVLPLAANPVCAGPGKFVVPIITVVAPLGAIESLLNVTGISVCVAGTVVTKDEVEMIVLPFGAILSTGTGMVVTTDEADGPLAAVFTPKIPALEVAKGRPIGLAAAPWEDCPMLWPAITVFTAADAELETVTPGAA